MRSLESFQRKKCFKAIEKFGNLTEKNIFLVKQLIFKLFVFKTKRFAPIYVNYSTACFPHDHLVASLISLMEIRHQILNTEQAYLLAMRLLYFKATF